MNEIMVSPCEMEGERGNYAVAANLANGYASPIMFEGKLPEAVAFANGVRSGMMLALNAIGFVPAPKIELPSVEVEA